jgi:hypothetical protein
LDVFKYELDSSFKDFVVSLIIIELDKYDIDISFNDLVVSLTNKDVVTYEEESL